MAITAPSPYVGSTVRSRRPALASRPLPRRSARLRLTRRGRMVVTLVLAMPVILGAVVANHDTADAGTTAVAQLQATGRVVVQPGESLWGIAQQVAPSVDPRETVLRIRELNGLGSDRVEAGQALTVPVYN